MNDYLNEIDSKYSIRRNDKEKQAFYEYVNAEIGEGRVSKQTIGDNKNIVIDDILSADVIFTAHYDTPAASIVPNMMMPRNKILGTLINMLFPIFMALSSLGIASLIGYLANLDEGAVVAIYLVLYFGLYFILTRMLPNKHNKNDNTSGVATVLSIAKQISDKKVAFVLFDNEEKGLLGSKALNKKYKSEFENKLVINFDCVGNGDQMIFITKEKAEAREEYLALEEVLKNCGEYDIHYVPLKKACSNSDYKSFPCSIGVMACSKGKFAKAYTGRIHTSRDTVASAKNICFLSDMMIKMLDCRTNDCDA